MRPMNTTRRTHSTKLPIAIILGSALLGAAIVLSGCRDGDRPLDGDEPLPQTSQPTESDRPVGASPTTDPPAASAPPADDDSTFASFLGLRGPKPDSWTVEPPPNRMVDTNFRVPAPDGSRPANINVFFFGAGMGGSIEDNIDRWAGQFRSPDGGPVEPALETFETGGMTVTMVELAGSYQGMGDPEPSDDQLMLSAIIDAPAGRIFIRLVGDAATVEHNREDYMSFIRGLRRAE